MMPQRTTKRITVLLPSDLKAIAKRKAAAEGRSLNSLIEEGLRVTLRKRDKARRAPRPISASC